MCGATTETPEWHPLLCPSSSEWPRAYFVNRIFFVDGQLYALQFNHGYGTTLGEFGGHRIYCGLWQPEGWKSLTSFHGPAVPDKDETPYHVDMICTDQFGTHIIITARNRVWISAVSSRWPPLALQWHRLPNSPHSMATTYTSSSSDDVICRFARMLVIAGDFGTPRVFGPTDGATAWHELPPMRIPRVSFSMVPFAGSLLAIGGHDSQQRVLCFVEMYNPDLKVWTPHASLNEHRMSCRAVLVGDDVWVFGGETFDVLTIETIERLGASPHASCPSWQVMSLPVCGNYYCDVHTALAVCPPTIYWHTEY